MSEKTARYKRRYAEADRSEQEEKKPFIREIMEYVVWFASVIIIVQIITRFVGVFSVVDGESMEPTLYHGEYLWVDKLGYHVSDPERYDVVIFPVEYGEETRHFVKRIIGLPNETVYIDEAGSIYIDDKLLADPYGKEVIASYNRYRAAEPITLGPDEYFVLGDNRNHSSDSRVDIVGNVKRSEIDGHVVVCLWPFDKIGIVK